MKQRHTTGQGLLCAAHEAEDLRAGHPEITGGIMLVNVDLNIREQLRRILNLVDPYWRLMKLEEQRGFDLSKMWTTEPDASFNEWENMARKIIRAPDNM